MMAARMVLALVVSQVFESWVPLDVIRVLSYLITNPKISHFHASSALAFDGVICDSDGSRVVAMDRGFRLWMAEFFEGEAKDHAFFAVEEEGTEFGFGGGSNDET
jgi:hypothetical protein